MLPVWQAQSFCLGVHCKKLAKGAQTPNRFTRRRSRRHFSRSLFSFSDVRGFALGGRKGLRELRTNSKGKVLLRIRVRGKSIVLRVLVDTGACLTVVSLALCNKLGLSIRPLPDHQPLFSACGRPLAVLGCVDLARVSFPGGAQRTIRALVLAELSESFIICLLYTSPSPRDVEESRMPSSA